MDNYILYIFDFRKKSFTDDLLGKPDIHYVLQILVWLFYDKDV